MTDHPLPITLLVALALAAGCLEAPATEPATRVDVVDGSGERASRGPGTFWAVEVTGTQVRDPPPPYACDVPFVYDFDRNARVVTFNSHFHDLDAGNLDVLVGFKVFQERSDCPTDHRLDANPGGAVTARLGDGADVTFTVHANGSITVADGPHVPLGEAAVVTVNGTGEDRDGTYTFQATARIENLGAWDRDHVRAWDG